MSEPIIGIDLGTTNSLVAIADERGPVCLEAPKGSSPIVPSVVRYEADDAAPGGIRTVVGADARERAVEFPQTTVSSVKRLMGRSLRDASADLPYLSYEVIEGEHATARVALPLGESPRVVSPQEVSAVILRDLKRRAEEALGTQVKKAVVTVPAYFDDAQRQATRDAGRLAGLDVVRIVNEPTAAALAYGLGLERSSGRNTKTRTVAVYDLGGGTFDISILRLTPADEGDEDGTNFFQVLSTAGDTHLGGDDVDHALVRLFLSEMGVSDQGTLPPAARKALVRFAQDVKHRLSEEETASVRIDGGGDIYQRVVTRTELDAIMAPWLDRTVVACARALRDARKQDPDLKIDAVVLVGGSTRIPLVRMKVREIFGVEPYTALDPDRVVALGAAVQGSILSGSTKGQLLLDVIPLSLGIETAGGAVAKLIVRNSPVPARATETFTTSVDGQTSIKLNILQGEREMVEDCRSLGEFHLAGLPPMPAGIPQLRVEFLVDANGVLKVEATERRSGKRAALQIVPNHGLASDEVDRIEAESFAHAKEDMIRHRIADLIVNSKLDLKWIGERLEQHSGKLDATYHNDLRTKFGTLRGLVESAESDWSAVDPDRFARAKQELDEASVRLQEIAITSSLKGS